MSTTRTLDVATRELNTIFPQIFAAQDTVNVYGYSGHALLGFDLGMKELELFLQNDGTSWFTVSYDEATRAYEIFVPDWD